MTPRAPAPSPHHALRGGGTASRKRPLLCRKSRAGSGDVLCRKSRASGVPRPGQCCPEATRRGRIRRGSSRHDRGPRTASRTRKAPDSPPAKQPFVFHSRRPRPGRRGGRGRASALTALKQVTARQGPERRRRLPGLSLHEDGWSLHTSVSAGCSEHVTPRQSEHPGFQKVAAALSRR